LQVQLKLLSTNKKVSMRKENSTNSINEEIMLARCGMSYTLSVLGGRWKPAILFTLLKGKMRYNELRKGIEGVSERMLVAQLRELEEAGLVKRIIYAEVPPKVEYELTEMGHDTAPMLRHMSAWGNRHRTNKQTEINEKAAGKKEAVVKTIPTHTKVEGRKATSTKKEAASRKKAAII